jgi:antitoxin FitA
MPNITVKNIPDDLYIQLKRSARINRRSINQEIIMCIESTVQSKIDSPSQLLEKARRLRKKSAGHPISDAEFKRIRETKRL